MPACIQQWILHADLKICIYFNIVTKVAGEFLLLE